MTWKAVILFGLALGSQAVRIPTHLEIKKNVGPKAEHRKELIHIGSEEPEHHEEYAWAYPSYEFSYSVDDPHTHDHKGQHEKRHGDEVTGEYWLLQPDGKKRTVKYHADKHKGFNAHVHYADHHHEEPHHEEPHHKEIVKPVEEDINDEPEHEVEMSKVVVEEAGEEEQKEDENIDIEEQKEETKEESQEEQEEKQVQHKPRGATHIEYYVLHKYHHDGHEIKHESKEESHEEHHEPIKHHSALPVEIISKIHHPIHNEHHGHVHEKHHHQIHYKPLINYHKHNKVPSHKSPLRLTMLNDEKKEHHSEEVSEPQAERKHHVEHAHIPPLRPYRPVIHRRHNKEYRRHHYRSIA